MKNETIVERGLWEGKTERIPFPGGMQCIRRVTTGGNGLTLKRTGAFHKDYNEVYLSVWRALDESSNWIGYGSFRPAWVLFVTLRSALMGMGHGYHRLLRAIRSSGPGEYQQQNSREV